MRSSILGILNLAVVFVPLSLSLHSLAKADEEATEISAMGDDIQARVSKDEKGVPLIEVKSIMNGMVTNITYHTDLSPLPAELASKYFFLSTGQITLPETLPAGCNAFPYGQSAHAPDANKMDFHVTLQGQACSTAVALFTAGPVKITFKGVRTGTGEYLGDIKTVILNVVAP